MSGAEAPKLEEQDDGKKLSRAEKKCRKAIVKMGLKSMEGITRVSIKRRDGLVFVIQDPEIFKNPNATGKSDSYVILGEMKMDEPKIDEATAKAAADSHAGHDHAGHDHPHEEPVSTEDGKVSEVPSAGGDDPKNSGGGDEAPEDEEGLTKMHIEMVMQNAGCTRNQAV